MAQTVQDDRCPKCLKPRFRGEQYCVNCGHLWPAPLVHFAPEPPKQIQFLVPTECPVCKNPNIQKISAFVAAHTQTTTSRGSQTSIGFAPGTGPIIMGGPSSSTGTTVSELVKRFMPPSAYSVPKYKDWKPGKIPLYGWLSCSLVWIGSVALWVLSPDPGLRFFSPIMIVVGIAILGGSTPKLSLPQGQIRENYLASIGVEHENQSRQLAWERCFYCPKCDTAFDPGKKTSVQSENAPSLWT